VIHNRSGTTLKVTNLRYVAKDGTTQRIDAVWTLAPGFNGYLTWNKQKVVARRIEYDLVTDDGKTVNWSAVSRRLDADGDFASVFTADNLATHRQMLGRVVARKPAPGPTEEQIKRGVVKVIGAAALHAAANREPEDLAQAFAIQLARKGRDELIQSAIGDLFPNLSAEEARAIRVLAIASLDGNLTPRGLRAAESQARVQDYLREKHPRLAAANEVARFLVGIDQQMKK
jgi:hypothetical protein